MPCGAGYKIMAMGTSCSVVNTAPSDVVAMNRLVAFGGENAGQLKLMPPPPIMSQQPPLCTGTHGLFRFGPNASSGVQRGKRAAKAS